MWALCSLVFLMSIILCVSTYFLCVNLKNMKRTNFFPNKVYNFIIIHILSNGKRESLKAVAWQSFNQLPNLTPINYFDSGESCHQWFRSVHRHLFHGLDGFVGGRSNSKTFGARRIQTDVGGKRLACVSILQPLVDDSSCVASSPVGHHFNIHGPTNYCRHRQSTRKQAQCKTTMTTANKMVK